MQTNPNKFKHKESESPLISLIEKKKEAFEGGSLMRVIRRDFAMVEEARKSGATWAEIAEAYAHSGKAAQARYAFFYERRRREKKGGMKDSARTGSASGPVRKPAIPVKKETEVEKYNSSFDIDAIDYD